MKYIYNNESHTDYSKSYMDNLGIDAETQDSILAMREFENQQFAEQEQAWVKSELVKLDEMLSKLKDGDERATMTEEEIRSQRKALRDYVKNENGVLSVNGVSRNTF